MPNMKRSVKIVVISFVIITVVLSSAFKTYSYASNQDATYEYDNNPSLTSPDAVNAAGIPDSVKAIGLNALGTFAKLAVCHGDDCEVNSEGYTQYLLVQMPANGVAMVVCDPDRNRFDDVTIHGADTPCTDPNTFAANAEEMLSKGKLPGGGAALLASAYNYAGTDMSIPTDLALYFKDTMSDTIFGTPAYAADPLDNTMFKGVVLGMWKITRNLALALLGVITAAAALMIIFRKKISAQAVVTVYNILPRIPIAILFILLSYPIAALLISLVQPLMGLAINLGLEIMKGSTTTENAVYYYISMAINSIFAIVVAMGALNVGAIVIIVVFVVIIVVILAVILIHIISAYVDMIINTVFAPIIGVMSILPGQERGIVNLVFRMIVDILTVPLIIFVILMGLAVIIIPVEEFGMTLAPPMAFFAMFWIFILKTIMGLMIMWQATKVKKMLKGAFSVTGLFETGQQKR